MEDGKIKMDVMARNINVSFEIAQDKSQQFLEHLEEQRKSDTALHRTDSYQAVPTGYDFSTTFDTFVLCYCPDTLSWFATNQRLFYYEYPKEFNTKEDAEEYFRKNAKDFYNIETCITECRPSFADGAVYLELNSKYAEKILVNNGGIQTAI